MKIIITSLLLAFSFMFINVCLADDIIPVQVTAVEPLAVAAVEGGGIMGWVAAHGGFQAAILLLVFSAFTMLSALREVLYKFDGVNKGDPIPPQYAGLTLVNKICVILGTIVDFMQGNSKH